MCCMLTTCCCISHIATSEDVAVAGVVYSAARHASGRRKTVAPADTDGGHRRGAAGAPVRARVAQVCAASALFTPADWPFGGKSVYPGYTAFPHTAVAG